MAQANTPARTISLWPREHGAYVQLAMPLLTALIIWPSGPGLLIAVGALLLFLAHESLLVLVGARGKPAARTMGRPALVRMLLLTVLSAIFGVGGLLLVPEAMHGVVAPGALGIMVVLMVLMRAEKTLPGELLISTSLSSVLFPVALAGGASLFDSGVAVAVWTVILGLQVLAVRAVKARGRGPAVATGLLCVLSLLGAGAVVLWTRHLASGLAPVVPVLGVSAVLLRGVKARQLARVGFFFTGLDLIAMVALYIGVHG